MKTIVNLHKQSSCCPSSWFGIDADGRKYYFRYQWGILKVHSSSEHDKPYKNLPDWEFAIGEEADGCFSQQKMITILEEKTPLVFQLESVRRPEMDDLLRNN
jgi:hypothetical protein